VSMFRDDLWTVLVNIRWKWFHCRNAEMCCENLLMCASNAYSVNGKKPPFFQLKMFPSDSIISDCLDILCCDDFKFFCFN